MISAHTARCRAIRQALDTAIDELDAALDTEADDVRLAILIANVGELERMLAAIEGV